LVGVSGGADSVALLRWLHASRMIDAGGTLVVAHFNHQLRGDAADEDRDFVVELAKKLELRCVTGRPTEPPLATQADFPGEALLRETRYRFLESTANAIGARYVALAHNRDDSVETILHNLFRGSGAAGVRGIPAFRNLGPDLVVARPLIAVGGSMIRQALDEINQPWRQDATNATDLWNRNWIRNRLLPQIRDRYPEADAAIHRAAHHIANQQADIQILATQFADAAVQYHGNRLRIASRNDLASPPLRSVWHAAMIDCWDAMRWPRGQVRKSHWDRLWAFYLEETAEPLVLPGNLHVNRQPDGAMVVELRDCD
jgi:tRNA(Ile)-lysidine synthase